MASFDTLSSLLEKVQSSPYLSVVPAAPAVKGKLCLNMIVKNESRIIRRLIDSVTDIIDSYCICDTGSTDDTISIIREYMAEKGKMGEVYEEPFKNFGYNRTHALDRAAKWAEYALLLDADMRLSISPDFSVDKLTDDVYTILQRNGSLDYFNTRIVRTGIGIKCVSPTHEYYDIPGGKITSQLKSLVIEDIGDGGAKSDKFERDVRLLRQGLEEEPGNVRYMSISLTVCAISVATPKRLNGIRSDLMPAVGLRRSFTLHLNLVICTRLLVICPTQFTGGWRRTIAILSAQNHFMKLSNITVRQASSILDRCFVILPV